MVKLMQVDGAYTEITKDNKGNIVEKYIDPNATSKIIKREALALDEVAEEQKRIIETLTSISREMNLLSDITMNVERGDIAEVAITLNDIDHKIIMIDRLLEYLLEDIRENNEDTEMIVETLISQSKNSNH